MTICACSYEKPLLLMGDINARIGSRQSTCGMSLPQLSMDESDNT